MRHVTNNFPIIQGKSFCCVRLKFWKKVDSLTIMIESHLRMHTTQMEVPKRKHGKKSFSYFVINSCSLYNLLVIYRKETIHGKRSHGVDNMNVLKVEQMNEKMWMFGRGEEWEIRGKSSCASLFHMISFCLLISSDHRAFLPLSNRERLLPLFLKAWSKAGERESEIKMYVNQESSSASKTTTTPWCMETAGGGNQREFILIWHDFYFFD